MLLSVAASFSPSEQQHQTQMNHSSGSSLRAWPVWCEHSSDSCATHDHDGFDALYARHWLYAHRPHLAAVIAVYLSVILMGALTPNRKPVACKRPQFVWNLTLAIYSWFSSFYLAGDNFKMLFENGWHDSVCNAGRFYNGAGGIGFVVFLFHLSKLVELGDTMWLVLSNRPVILLHWYHHFTVLLNAWLAYMDGGSIVRWAMHWNLWVHSIMYSYFALQYLCNKRLPRWMAASITSLQLMQFTAGIVMCAYAAYAIHMKHQLCDIDPDILWRHALKYLSYLVLFAHFFYTSYLAPKQRQESNAQNGKLKTQ